MFGFIEFILALPFLAAGWIWSWVTHQFAVGKLAFSVWNEKR